MKKIKELLALILALSICLGMLCVTAFATDGDEQVTNEPETPNTVSEPVTIEETAASKETAVPSNDPGMFCQKPAHSHSLEDGCYELTCTKGGSACTHVHDDSCGYVAAVEGHECGHIHDAGCGYVEAKAEVPCDKGCTDTNDDGVIDHVEGCAYEPAVEGHACSHVHDEACGYVEAKAEVPCTHQHDETCGFAAAEDGHQHSLESGCYTLTCETAVHSHVESCKFSAAWDTESKTMTISSSKNGEVLNRAILDELCTRVGCKAGDIVRLVISSVDSIAPYAFYTNGFETVEINNVNTVGNHAFFGSKEIIKTVKLANIGTVGNNAFAECKSLNTLTIENVNLVDAEAFRQDSALLSENLSLKNVKEFGRSAFSYCTGLTALDLDGARDNIGTLGTTMFYGCTGFKTVSLKNLDAIPVQIFNGCTGLESVDMENIKNVESSVLLNCKAADAAPAIALTLKNVTTGYQAFSGCTAIKTLTLTDVDTIGEQAFVGCNGMQSATLENVGTVGVNAFASCTALQELTLSNVGTIDKYGFYNCNTLPSATLNNVGTIGQYAFWKCNALETVSLNGVDNISNYVFWCCEGLKTINGLDSVTGSIGGFALYGCSSLDISQLSVAALTKMGFIGNLSDNAALMARVRAILAGTFQLDDAESINELELEGWMVGDIGRSENWNRYDNGTQLMEQARWQSDGSTVAEVKVDAYYTAQQQMDYIFVADLSASMAQLGNPSDSNARFYDMQSKLLDMTGKLLGTPGYDCKVAVVSFGGLYNGNQTVSSSDFMSDVGTAAAYINALAPLNENTDYGLGLQRALTLAQGNTGRNTVVIFLSDGAPNAGGSGDQGGTAAAAGIKALNVPIYGVLHSPTAAQSAKALANMNAVCGEVYQSTDTYSFGQAMNAAFTAAYGSNTVTVPVNAEEFDLSALSVSTGNASYSDGLITWTLNGMPFTQHTLSYRLTLKDDLAERVGTYSYSINGGNAARFAGAASGASVGTNLTLTREVAAPVEPEAPVAPVIPAAPVLQLPPVVPPVENIDDELTPLDEQTPAPIEDIVDEQTPLAQSEGWALVNLILAVITVVASILMLAGVVGKHSDALRVASVLPAAGSIVAFVLTENMCNPMTMVDGWTVLMLAIAVLQVVLAIVAGKRNSKNTPAMV